jgi:uncharacterized protein
VKYLLVVVVVVVAVWWWLRALRRSEQAPRPRDGHKPPARESQPHSMVACAHCGVHFPAGDALEAEGRHYCSAAHRDAGSAKR